ncbi:hypothetical protein G4V62_13915 [Bacillaceae bacterium SIJ1]|uniref:hypothetical protein n=1 Tax=Litoribacterium kuwaitense TaxID=1398745 RepID=UPI0013ECD117|nr:hypothetical protein [Litoribacterium kuwaitense]NGP45991.1 hypothetical protein [Litoribacterium kuwaitense]
MKERRNGLRPVTVTKIEGKIEGYFHCFAHEGDLDDGIGVFAVVERKDGSITTPEAHLIKFEDVE